MKSPKVRIDPINREVLFPGDEVSPEPAGEPVLPWEE